MECPECTSEMGSRPGGTDFIRRCDGCNTTWFICPDCNNPSKAQGQHVARWIGSGDWIWKPCPHCGWREGKSLAEAQDEARTETRFLVAMAVAVAIGGLWSANNTKVGCELTGGLWFSGSIYQPELGSTCLRSSGRSPSGPDDCTSTLSKVGDC